MSLQGEWFYDASLIFPGVQLFLPFSIILFGVRSYKRFTSETQLVDDWESSKRCRNWIDLREIQRYFGEIFRFGVQHAARRKPKILRKRMKIICLDPCIPPVWQGSVQIQPWWLPRFPHFPQFQHVPTIWYVGIVTRWCWTTKLTENLFKWFVGM